MANAEQLLSQAREYHEQGQMQTALDLYRSAVRANPRLADAHTQLGLALNQVGMDAEAVEHLEKSVKLQPTSAEALCNLAMTHRSQFRLDQALDCYERAAWLSKQYPRAVAGAAEIYAITGRQGKAHAMLLPYISSQQDPPAVALTYARCCGAIGKPADGAAAIARHLAGGAAMIPPPARAQMLLTLSRLGHDIEKYQQSFAAATDANRLYGRRFDARSHSAEIESLIANWTADRHKEIPRATSETEQPVLVVGMPRCGGALVEQILASHPGIAPAGETAVSRHLVSRLSGAGSHGIQNLTSAENLNLSSVNEGAGFYISALRQITKSDGYETPDRIVDRCLHNFLYLGMFDAMLPKARVIHVRRDPLDTFMSCFTTHFDIPYYFKAHPGDWAVFYQSYQRLMDHWRSIISLQMLEIDYEDLVRDFDATARKIVEFTGLEWDDACAEFHNTERRFVPFEHQGILKPIYESSIGRATPYESFLVPLRQQLGLPAVDLPEQAPAADAPADS